MYATNARFLLPALFSLFLAGSTLNAYAEQQMAGGLSSVAEFLSAVRTRGATLVCDTSLVEGTLGARMQSPKVTRQGDIYEAQYVVVPLSPSLIAEDGEYRQFRSTTTSFCELQLRIPEGTLCNVDSDQYRAIVGAAPVRYQPPHPSRSRTPDRQAFHLFGTGEPAQRDEVWLSMRAGENCVYRVVARTRGTFQEVP